jgi:molecular chaperone GrpE (heat shock protein)
MDEADKKEGEMSRDSEAGAAGNTVPYDTIDLTVLRLDGIERQLESLHQEFQDKLKYDAHKEKMIDNLYQELQDYKNDLVKKHLNSLIMDIIKIIDDIRKLTRHYRSKGLTDEDPPKLLEMLEDIPSDLENLLSWQGVMPFTCDEIAFDPKRQKVMRGIETFDKSEDRTVAESVRPGYEWDGKVIRHEMVDVYKFKKTVHV